MDNLQKPNDEAARGSLTCRFCSRQFKRPEHLQRHHRIHTKERPFKCPCGASFGRRDLLRRHERVGRHLGGEKSTVAALSTKAHRSQPQSVFEQCTLNESSLPSREPYEQDTAQQHVVASSDRFIVDQHAVQTTNYHNVNSTVLPSPTASAGLSSDNLQDISPSICEDTRLSAPESGHYHGSRETLDVDRSMVDFSNLIATMGLDLDWMRCQTEPDFVNNIFGSVDNSGSAAYLGAQTPMHTSQCHQSATTVPYLDKVSVAACPAQNGASILASRALPRGPDNMSGIQISQTPSPFIMTEHDHAQLRIALQPFSQVLTGFVLPSCHTFTRYLSAWHEVLNKHLPFIHLPTFRLEACRPEYILALATMGAQQRFENKKSEQLFRAAKAICCDRLLQLRNSDATHASSKLPKDPGIFMDLARCFVLLIASASWERDPDFVIESFILREPLVYCLSRDGLSESNDAPNPRWLDWAAAESNRRTKLTAFCFLNFLTIAYNQPPALLATSIRLNLPCSSLEWNAQTADDWVEVHSRTELQTTCQTALSLILSTSTEVAQVSPVPSPFGGYILLHFLLQRTFLVRQLVAPSIQPISEHSQEEFKKLQGALTKWASLWQRCPESSLDANNQNGPIPFTSVALLGLAYVRLNFDIGPHRRLETRDPHQVAHALSKAPDVSRSLELTSALLYAVHALSIPAGLGINYVTHSQGIFWSCQHAICSLECAVFLSQWLHTISISAAVNPLNAYEIHVIQCLSKVLEEAFTSLNYDSEDVAKILQDRFLMGYAVIELWAHIFTGTSPWPITSTIGKSLAKYKDMYKAKLFG